MLRKPGWTPAKPNSCSGREYCFSFVDYEVDRDLHPPRVLESRASLLVCHNIKKVTIREKRANKCVVVIFCVNRWVQYRSKYTNIQTDSRIYSQGLQSRDYFKRIMGCSRYFFSWILAEYKRSLVFGKIRIMVRLSIYLISVIKLLRWFWFCYCKPNIKETLGVTDDALQLQLFKTLIVVSWESLNQPLGKTIASTCTYTVDMKWAFCCFFIRVTISPSGYKPLL